MAGEWRYKFLETRCLVVSKSCDFGGAANLSDLFFGRKLIAVNMIFSAWVAEPPAGFKH